MNSDDAETDAFVAAIYDERDNGPAIRAAKAETLREVRGFVSAMRQAENTPTLGEIEHYIDAQLAALSGDQP